MTPSALSGYAGLLVYAAVGALCVFGTYHLFGKKWARACMIALLIPVALVPVITAGTIVSALLEPPLPPCSTWVHFNCR